ncbi:DUF6543 domain-containing protein [Pseudomonas sp. dw_358]|uniref:dermonecrotic toxin domain-containing protein n=1 Tax=Pseudomonas sp. dw_358 TaxID=2720083 RepID=UPI001BD50113|nr:DUF6543 domain-containing protein [Pseudomonas sp. dw_358]
MLTRHYLPPALQADFARDVRIASLDQACRTALDALALSGKLPPQVRAHHLMRTDLLPLPGSLAGTWVLEVGVDQAEPGYFLHSSWYGLESFDDRASLSATLQERLDGGEIRLLAIRADESMFETRMQYIAQAHLERLERFQEQWAALPVIARHSDTESAEAAISQFWNEPASHAASRRQQLAGVLADAYQYSVLEAEHEQLLQPQEARWLKQAVSRQGVHKLSLYSDPQSPIKLAGVWLLHDASDSHGLWFLYLTNLGLHLFASQSALHDWLIAEAWSGRLSAYLSFNDQAALRTLRRPALRLDAPSHDLFVDRADSLIGLQKRNLAFTLGLPPGAPRDLVAACDVLPLISPSLQRLPTTPDAGLTPLSTEQSLPSLAFALRYRLYELETRRINLDTCARARLNMAVAALDPRLGDAELIRVTLADGSYTDLMGLFLDRLGEPGVPKRIMAKQPGGLLNPWPGRLIETLLDTSQARLEVLYRALLLSTRQAQLTALLDVRQQTAALELKLTSDLTAVKTVDTARELDLQSAEQQRQLTAVAQSWARCRALHMPLPALDNALALAAQDQDLANRLEQLCQNLPAVALAKVLPPWLLAASNAARREYAIALDQLHRTEEQVPDYRSGIPSLHDYARSRLMPQLARRQPAPALDPDKVRIEMATHIPAAPWVFGHTGFIPASVAAATLTETNTLTAYAISHFSRSQTAVLRAHQSDGSPIPDWMTPRELHRLVDGLDIGGGYRQLLHQQLSSTAPLYNHRRQHFAARSEAQLRVAAIQARLSGDISAQGFAWVDAVLSMPDGAARKAVGGHTVHLRPMALLPAPDVMADRVTDLYLIGPLAGPVVLYAAVGARFVFKEFASDETLLAAARAEGPLQTLIVQQVAPSRRSLYAHGGLRQAHRFADSVDPLDFDLPATPVQLATQAWNGNAWHLLFTDRVALIQALAVSQSVSSGEAHWASFTFLMGLGIEQMSFLAEGRLAQLLGLWGGIVELDAAVEAADRHQWGASLGQLALALLALGPLAADGVQAIRTPAAQVSSDPLLATELRRFETSTALGSLKHDPASGLYQAADGSRYAQTDGRVYPVWQAEGLTRIGTEHHCGPRLHADAQRQWQLERLWDFRFGGFQSRCVRQQSSSSGISQLLTVRAIGMPAIRAFSMDKARRIGQAHAYAKRRLEVALDNLHADRPGDPLPAQSSRVLADFFGVATPSPHLIGQVLQCTAALYTELLDSSLSPWSSPRFAYGINLPTAGERLIAMVAKDDAARRIFFSELFFDLPTRIRYQHGRLLAPFELPAHMRAATLIHELSHLVHDAEDIAYVEPGAPYRDLIDPTDPVDPSFKADVSDLQDNRLSVTTPWARLFQRLVGGRWQPLEDLDPDASARVLKETGCQNMDDARNAFYADEDKRIAVILANADSIALLVMLLGRDPFTLPIP